MACPGCGQAMARQTFDAHYGRRADLDLCHACAALWFDRDESVSLTPRAVLELFTVIHEGRTPARIPLRDGLSCPRCRVRLARTVDAQRSTRFAYWRCPREHGRFTTFFDFLREKAFIRPLAPRELAELKRNIRTLACSSCGAPVDLERDSACPYCRAPIAMLDAKQVEKVIEALKEAEVERRAAAAELPLRLFADRAHVQRVFNELERSPEWGGVSDSFGVMERGLGAVAALLKGVA